MFPGLGNLMGIIPKAYDNIFRITKDIMKARRESGTATGGDFIGRMMELIDDLKNKKTDHKSILNEDILTAQGIIFFVAGFETTAFTLGKWFQISSYSKTLKCPT